MDRSYHLSDIFFINLKGKIIFQPTNPFHATIGFMSCSEGIVKDQRIKDVKNQYSPNIETSQLI